MRVVVAFARRKVPFAFLCFDTAPQNHPAGAGRQTKWNLAWERFPRGRAGSPPATLARRWRAIAPFSAPPDCDSASEDLASSPGAPGLNSTPSRNPFPQSLDLDDQ